MLWFDEDDLRWRAGNRSYVRGTGYVSSVEDLCWSPKEVTATAQGTDTYQVRLSNHGGLLSGECSCPWGQEGNFCKHCVAVGLVAINGAPSRPPAPKAANLKGARPKPAKRSAPEPEPPAPDAGPVAQDVADLRASLEGLEKATLIDLLMELAERDQTAGRLLSLRTNAVDPDPAALSALVDGLKRTRRLSDVALTKWCRAADDALRTLDTFAAGHPAAVRPLYQRALRHLTAPDFDGRPDSGLVVVREVVDRAVDGLVATCRATPPDPVEFARWLADVQVRSSRFPGFSVGPFAEVLGAEGLASYWQRLSDLEENASSAAGPGAWLRRRAIFRLREAYLIDVVKNVDRLVEFYADDLSLPERYVRIGATLRAAGRCDEAIAWLQRGMAEAPWGRKSICDLLVAVYAETGRLKEAARARLDNFTRDPDEYNYRKLLEAAEAIDAVTFARAQAMTMLRERAKHGGANGADPLVRILVAIDEIDEAWAAAQVFGCSDECKFLLARNRAKHHPGDAIPIYTQEVDNAIARMDREGYETAARLLVQLRDLHQRAGSDFGVYLDHVKSTHRRKGALMERLADARL
ncbi:SWIM zinc finger family protein [Micromonospora carbonacea]|uniref:SWIM zinc finger family protein n=1 Tax=Micromonospora carbonacea TaxID=47853 RepID=UPI003711385F